MAYLYLKDFKGGLDTRRMALHTPDGALVRLENAHITRGGEIEKRRAFVKLYDLPPGTFGLAAGPNHQVTVFGSAADPGVPAGVTYSQLVPASGANMVDAIDQDTFARNLYVVATFDNGETRHFYNEVEVTDANYPAEFPFARTVMPFNNKMYGVVDNIMAFSTIGDPSDWIDEGGGAPPGAGFIDLDAHSSGAQEAVGMSPYRGLLAMLAKSTVQIWSVDDDPALNLKTQSLDHIGTRSPHAVVEYGGSDVFFLHDSGVRSLRARDSSNSAYVTDIGTAIDTLVQAKLEALTDAQVERAHAVVEERDGRLLMALDDLIYVFSFFPESKVSAWSTYLPGFTVDHMETYGKFVYVRSGDSVYVLGGTDGNTYDTSKVVARTPWLGGDQPATQKVVNGFDAACRNVWDVDIGYDFVRYGDPYEDQDGTALDLAQVHAAPSPSPGFERLATIQGPTYSLGDIEALGHSSHVALEMVCTRDGPARLGSMALHYELAEAG